MTLHIQQLQSRLTDNTFYILHDAASACLIDPIDPQLALDYLATYALTPTCLLTTHWHPDHVGGNAAILAVHPSLTHMIPAAEADLIDLSASRNVRALRAGDVVRLGSYALDVLETPGHTVGHISLVCEDILVCGDTIFSAGVGHCKLGGDVDVLTQTLRATIAQLDHAVRIFCGHDYALKNLAFARSVLPNDPAIIARQAHLSHPGSTPVITTLGEERTFNLFMRCEERAVQEAARRLRPEVFEAALGRGQEVSGAAFCALRAARDVW
jgi:hydroxyacylglutathione hydrolase